MFLHILLLRLFFLAAVKQSLLRFFGCHIFCGFTCAILHNVVKSVHTHVQQTLARLDRVRSKQKCIFFRISSIFHLTNRAKLHWLGVTEPITRWAGTSRRRAVLLLSSTAAAAAATAAAAAAAAAGMTHWRAMLLPCQAFRP